MTKKSHLFAASLHCFLSGAVLAACSAKTEPGGPAPVTSGLSSTETSSVTPTGPATDNPTTTTTPPASNPTSPTSNTSSNTSSSSTTSSSTTSTSSNTSTTTDSSEPFSDSSLGSDSSTTTTTAPVDTGDVDCVLPNLPDSGALTYENEKLPDPFTFYDGTKVTTKAQWECRRKEILAIGAKYIYGPVPGEPDEVTGTVSGGNVSITAKVGDKTEMFTATISGSGQAIALELSGGIYPSSRKKLSFGSGFEGKIRSLFGISELNTNVANGWMIDRVMDVLEQNPDSGHDPQKIMVSGCSGCGKGAFLAGVFSRAPLVVIVESGGGGAANLRQAEWFRHGAGKSSWQCADALPQSIDNLEDNGICGPWVTGAASWLRSNPAKVVNLPIDQHLLLATIAPRHLLHFSNNNGVNSWCHLGGTCEALSAWAAKPVWKALGVPERMGFHMYSAGHCSNPGEATSLANEFFKRVFDGNNTANTDVMNIMANGVQQPVGDWKDMWIDWDMETVLQ